MKNAAFDPLKKQVIEIKVKSGLLTERAKEYMLLYNAWTESKRNRDLATEEVAFTVSDTTLYFLVEHNSGAIQFRGLNVHDKQKCNAVSGFLYPDTLLEEASSELTEGIKVLPYDFNEYYMLHENEVQTLIKAEMSSELLVTELKRNQVFFEIGNIQYVRKDLENLHQVALNIAASLQRKLAKYQAEQVKTGKARVLVDLEWLTTFSDQIVEFTDLPL